MRDNLASATIAINSLAMEKKRRGEHIYNFAAGDPIIPSHPKVKEAVVHALESEMVLYPPVAGLSSLRKKASEWMQEQYHCAFQEANTLVTAGGKFALFAALQLLLKQGDEVLIPAPYWVSYPQIVVLFGGMPVIVSAAKEKKWKLTPEILKRYITARSKILILNSACNPTGTLYTEEELKLLLQVAADANLFVISDEVYSELVYDEKQFYSCGAFSDWQDRVLVVQSCSKNFGMTGWRVGFAFGPEPLIRSMTSLQGQSTTGASTVSQWAALAALENHAEISSFVRSTMQTRRNLFYETLNTLFRCKEEKPLSSLYAFLPLASFNLPFNSTQSCTDLLTRANIATVPGIAFGQEGYFRLAFSETEAGIKEGLAALHQAVQR